MEPLVVVYGRVYLDLVLAGLGEPPQPGREVYAAHSAMAPGGVANVAVALARLGARVQLLSTVGADPAGRLLLESLAAEGIDCVGVAVSSYCHTPVTAALAYAGDRALITHEESLSIAMPPPETPWWDAVQGFFTTLRPGLTAAVRGLAARGIACFGDTAWDASGAWAAESLDSLPHLATFLVNETEALAYSRAAGVEAALAHFAARTPVAVVKRGARGAVARAGAEIVAAPSLVVQAVDTTGAGDVFNAGYIYGHLTGRPLPECLRLANLAAGLSVTRLGGSLAAPTQEEVRRLLS